MTTQNTHQLTNDIQRNSVLNTRYELTVPEYLCKAHIYNSTGYELTVPESLCKAHIYNSTGYELTAVM